MKLLARLLSASFALALAVIILGPGIADAGPHLIDGRMIRAGSVQAGAFAAGSIDADDIATSGVATAEILDGTVAYNDIDNTATLGGNLALAASECWFATTGLLCEGSTADTIETLMTWADPSGSDVTITVPATTGTLISHAMFSGDATVSSAGAVTIASGAVEPSMVAGLAHTASTVRARTPQFLTMNFVAADFVADDDLPLTFPAGHAVLILDMFLNQTTAEGGALTATLYTAANGGGSAISASVDLNSAAGTVLRPTTFVPTAVAASGSVYLNGSANPSTVAGAVTLVYVHTD